MVSYGVVVEGQLAKNWYTAEWGDVKAPRGPLNALRMYWPGPIDNDARASYVPSASPVNAANEERGIAAMRRDW